MAPASPIQRSPGALELLESALNLLRRVPGWLLVIEWMAIIPFALTGAWAVADLSHHPRAVQRALFWATALSLLHAWAAVGQACFAVELRRRLNSAQAEPWTARRLWDLAIPQIALQGLGAITLPIALLLALPFPRIFVWHQSIAVVGDLGHGRVRSTAAHAWARSGHDWPGLLAVMGLLAACAAVLALNLAVTLFAVPHLLNTLLAIESHIALSPALALNATFLSVVAATTWILMDPVIKAVFTLRLFHHDSRTTGEDLLTCFAPRASSAAFRLLLPLAIVGLLLGTYHAAAQESPLAPSPSIRLLRAETPAATADRVQRSVETVLERPEFAWRLPPSPELDSDLGDAQWLDRLRESLVQFLRRLRDLIGGLLDWLDRQLRGNRTVPGPTPAWLDWLQSPQTILALSLLILAAGGIWLAWSRFRLRRIPQVQATAVATAPDLNAEELLATDLPPEDWRRLADDLARRGETRLAIRALYLATLADLATRGLLMIARFKSNADYLAELKRRPRATPPLVNAFAHLMRSFECVWYGAHPATPDLFHDAAADARRLRP